MATRVDSSSTTASRGGVTDSDFTAALQTVSREAWEFALTQAREGGAVSDASPELMALYRQHLKQTKQSDTPARRVAFLDQLAGRLESKAREAVAETGLKPTFGEAVAMMKNWSSADELAFKKQFAAQLGERDRRTDKFDRTRTTSAQTPSGPNKNDNRPITVETLEEYYPTNAKTPDEALSMRTDKVARDDKLLKRLEGSIARGANPFTGDDGEVARRAYVDFLGRRGVKDSPQSRALFVDLLKERRAQLSSSGAKNFDVSTDKRFYATAALQRLQARAGQGGPLELGPSDRWMISALSDPSVKFTAEEQKVLDRVQWHDMGLRTTLGELAAQRKANADWRPGLGQPYKTMLNASNVFSGDPQVNAFTMAAKTAGYSQGEIELAAKYLGEQGIDLYVDRDQPGEPRINTLEEARSVNIGGQNFVSYSMSSKGAEVLRDARYALQQGYTSVDQYRKDFNNTWSDRVGWLGSKFVELEQAKDKLLGLDQNQVFGPLVRGKYDAMRELVLVGSNAANLAQMGVANTQQFIQTGDPFVSIAKNEELNRYFDNSAARVEQTFTELGRTYSPTEQGLIAELARGTVAGVPKMAVNLIPGAAIYYNALKHANHDINEFAKETAIDLASLAGGFALSRVTSSASTFASTFVNKELAKATVTQVVARGTSAVGGATMNVALEMGPTAVNELLRSEADRATMTEAEKKEVSEKLSMRAFTRNVFSGAVFGLIAPGRHQKDDLITLSKPGAELDGPLFKTTTPGGVEQYSSAVKITENGKTRVEFIEVDPQGPKAQAAIKAGRVKEGRQPDVDLALAQSRYGRLDEKGRAQLMEAANSYAAKKMLADADQGVTLSSTGSKASLIESLKTSTTHRRELSQGLKDWEKGLNIPPNPVRTLELSKVEPPDFLAAFGEGPYSPALFALFEQPGFGDLTRASPEKAGALYRANEHTWVTRSLDETRSALKPRVPPAELNATTFEAVLKQLEWDGTQVARADGWVTIERKPGRGRPWEMIVDDDAGRQMFPTRELDADGKRIWKPTAQMARITLDELQFTNKLSDKPIDLTRTGVILTHGSTSSLMGMTPERVTAIAQRIVKGGGIDQVVLAACFQGDKRPQGATYAQKFWGELNAEVKRLSGGKKTVDVYASKQPGLLTGTNYNSGSMTMSVGDKPLELVPVLQQGNLFDVPAEWSKAYKESQVVRTKVDVTGGRAFIYVIRVNDSSSSEEQPAK